MLNFIVSYFIYIDFTAQQCIFLVATEIMKCTCFFLYLISVKTNVTLCYKQCDIRFIELGFLTEELKYSKLLFIESDN